MICYAMPANWFEIGLISIVSINNKPQISFLLIVFFIVQSILYFCCEPRVLNPHLFNICKTERKHLFITQM